MSDTLNTLLEQLSNALPDIKCTFLFNVDGLLLAGNTKQSYIDDIGAAAAAIKSIAERSSQLVGRGTLQHVHAISEAGSMLIHGLGEECILVIITQTQANIGLIAHEIKAISPKILAQVSA